MKCMSGECKTGRQIISVAVYPSEFGLKRMEEEAVRGPVLLFDDDKEQNESDDEIDVKKLREYELSRLRYYYAVVDCDSIATADYLYKSYDGIEFKRSSNKLDLRFIPDSMEFKHPPRDATTEASANYEGLDFQTRALQRSNIHLTWEDDEPQRVKALKRKFNGDQLAEMELKEFLASDESESDEDENDNATEDKPQKKQDVIPLLQSGEDSDDDNEDGQDMEASKEGKGKSDKKGKKNEEKAKEAEAASMAELELLLAAGNGADTSLKGYNLKPKKVEGKGRKGRKEKRGREKEIPDEGKLPSVDYDDPSETYAQQLAQKQRKGDQEVLGSKQAQLPSDDLKTEKNEFIQSDDMSSKKKEKYELSSLVRSIKMKLKQVQIPTDCKISGKTGKSGSKAR
ncbi:hypothetical protein RHSIM_Rhsim08G0030900 [Rhododendron simsii]|uniref:ESF1 RRM domain-containing protein n=1 Tax=Rhododendron simsii TaxID=118357 RepID=A0A834GJN9_RHOSS|nr:hypothetical protein RHSIM_Rhsim08G0030900 [Rhododendron simsii]